MPKAFNSCVKRGGRVRTITYPGTHHKYRHICFIGGHSYAGHSHTAKNAGSKAHKGGGARKVRV